MDKLLKSVFAKALAYKNKTNIEDQEENLKEYSNEEITLKALKFVIKNLKEGKVYDSGNIPEYAELLYILSRKGLFAIKYACKDLVIGDISNTGKRLLENGKLGVALKLKEIRKEKV